MENLKIIAIKQIIENIRKGIIKDRHTLEDFKREYCKKFKIDTLRNSEILEFVNEKEREKFLNLLQKKPRRTLSGVTVVACMTSPEKCPHGKCTYCPGGVEINVPQSYTGKEPSTMRAIQYNYDPYLMTTFRLYQLYKMGHPVDKVELIIQGGTFPARDICYQEYFVKECLIAMNDFYKNLRLISKGEEKFLEIYKNLKNEKFKNKKNLLLENVQKKNEKSYVRCVGMTFESRPDYAKKEEIAYLAKLGATRIELGVQIPYDFIYAKVNRGHTVKDVIESTKAIKEFGLKVCYHIMPGLLGNDEYSIEIDRKGFRKIFEDENFRPDMLKIYPTLIIKGTKYYDEYINGNFTPMSTENVVKIIAEIYSYLPKWVRVMRVMRDIPANLIVAGVKASNLEEIVDEYMKKNNIKTKEIRHREVKNLKLIDYENVKLLREDYEASNGKEIFLSYEDIKDDLILGFLRLRIPANFEKSKTAFIRELHIYGKEIGIGKKNINNAIQHKGLGKNLIESAERISKEEFNAKKILVMSGIGVREYYRNLNYKKMKFWMGKLL